MVFRQKTDGVKERIMQTCASLFENVIKAHQANLDVARDLKDLANMVREPKVFSRIAQAATQPIVTCYTPRIDTFIKQHQVLVGAKQEKLSKHKSIMELMEMSNLPQYNVTWGRPWKQGDGSNLVHGCDCLVFPEERNVWYYSKR